MQKTKKFDKVGTWLVIAAAFALLPGRAHAVDGVTLITQAQALAGNVTAGDSPGFPVTISRSGSFRLASNLTVTDADVDGIEITANSVTLDLNGHSIVGTSGGTGTGIVSASSAVDTTVTNGTVRNMGARGIQLNTAVRIADVTATQNGSDGFFVRKGSRVTGCVALNNGNHGIRIGASSVVTGNISIANRGAGINEVISTTPPTVPGGGSLVKDNTASRNIGLGLNLGTSTGYGNNVLQNNAGGNNNPQVNGGIELGTNVCGFDSICP